MLTELLRAIADPRRNTKEGLARALNLSAQQVDEGIRQLVRAGYVTEEVVAGCESGCGGCLRHCAERMPVFVSVTAKGRRFLTEKR